MTDADSDRRQNIALFRYRLIADLLQPTPDDKGLNQYLAAKPALDYTIPGSTRALVAAETLRDWLKAYRRGGVDAILPKERADRGLADALSAAAVEALPAAKEDNPKLSVQLVIRAARKCADVPPELPLPSNAVHRVLTRHGLIDRPKGRPGRSGSVPLRLRLRLRPGRADVDERCDARAERPGGRSHQAQDLLTAFIDDATQVVAYAAFALSATTASLLPVGCTWTTTPITARHTCPGTRQAGHCVDPCPPLPPAGQGKIER